MSYRDDLDALEARVDALRGELDQATRLAGEARKLVRQRVLEAELATPCTAEWGDMKGDDRVRHCGTCNKHVYNFAELTRDEIDAVIIKTEGRLCGRLFLRADGTILTKDCTRDLRVRPTRLAVGLGAAAIAASAMLAVGGIAKSAMASEPSPYEGLATYSGGMAIDEPPPPEEEPAGSEKPEELSSYAGGMRFPGR